MTLKRKHISASKLVEMRNYDVPITLEVDNPTGQNRLVSAILDLPHILKFKNKQVSIFRSEYSIMILSV